MTPEKFKFQGRCLIRRFFVSAVQPVHEFLPRVQVSPKPVQVPYSAILG